MPVLTPKYRLHKGSGQALVQIRGRRIYLGKYDTEESKGRYRRIVAEYLKGAQTIVADKLTGSSGNEMTVNELILAYWRFAQGYYVKDGKPTGELGNIRDAMRSLQPPFGHTVAAEFGPSALKAVREAMIDADLSRPVVNARVNRIRRAFKWAVENEFIPPSVLQGLQTLAPLKRGRTIAREPDPVKPVPAEDVDAIRPYVSRQVWAIIQLQRLTGMRSGEVTNMRGRDLDTTGTLWLYRPVTHKTEHHCIERVVELGPRSQAIVQEFFRADMNAYLFSPAEAVAERRAERRQNRKTPVTPSESRRRRKRCPKRSPGDRYTPKSYAMAIRRACRCAGVPHWHPHQVRHSFGTRMRKEYGLEVARVQAVAPP